VAVAVLSVSIPAAAQTLLSEADAVARLSADSPRVRAIRAVADLARADVQAASRWPSPVFTYNREAVAGVTENMFLVTERLAITGRRQLEAAAASALVEASVHRGDDEIRTARAALRLAYADLVAAQQQEAVLEAARDRLADVAGVVAKREQAGDAAGYDRLRAEREVLTLAESLSAAHVDRARAQAALAGFFPEPGDPMTLVATDPDPAAAAARPLPSLEELLARARMVRGEPAAIRKEIEAARIGEEAAARRHVPEPEIVAGTKSSTFGGGDVGSVVSVHVPVPIFNATGPEQARARARRSQAEAKAAAFDVSLRAEIAGARAVLLERRATADRHRALLATPGARLEQIAQVSYDAGERGVLELLDAYRTSATEQLRQVDLDGAVRRGEIELELVSGWEAR